MRQRLQKIKTSFLFFLELQLLISIVMLPILIAWGLPISTMTIIGNLIFSQFLTVFILLSAILFTCDLIGIPNNLIVVCLEWTAHAWHYLLSFGSAHWLVGFASFMFPFSCFAAICACAMYTQRFSQNKRILMLIILCASIPLTNYIFQKPCLQTTVLQGKQKMHIIKSNGFIYAFDCGALGAHPSSQSWIEYTLAPTMIKTMGATHIDTLILCKSNSRTQSATKTLTDLIPVDRIISLQ